MRAKAAATLIDSLSSATIRLLRLPTHLTDPQRRQLGVCRARLYELSHVVRFETGQRITSEQVLDVDELGAIVREITATLPRDVAATIFGRGTKS